MTIECSEEPLDNGITLSCRACGPREAPRLVFLHGFPEGAFVWDALLERLGTRWRCVAPNLRGYERSSQPPEVEAYRAKALVGDLVALVDRLGGGPLEALVAHDWGGAVAWAFAAQHPPLLKRLVIVNAPHPGTFLRELQRNPAQQQASAYMNFLRRPGAGELLRADDYARLWPFFERTGANWLDASARARYRALWDCGLEGALNYYRASPLYPPTAADRRVMDLTFAPEAVTVHVPTRVIWAEDDTALLPSLLDGLEAFVPDLRIVRVPGATHWIVHERPERVAIEIEAALAR